MIRIQGLVKRYGATTILHGIDLGIERGSFVALVGPSGCGKSTLLRSIAGLESISGGQLEIDGRDVTDRPPRERDVAMVFQSYALYPHMSVEHNMSYALRLRKAAPDAIRRVVDAAAGTLGLDKLLQRSPRELSGGQRQRVAMGRAIVRSPKVFLFDEPLSNLDAALRVHMRSEIRRLHQRLAATSVYVTHDQIEAMTMADRVVVMRGGRIEQHGAPLELYDRPANRFVAGFIGSPAMNFVDGEIAPNGREVRLAGGAALALGRTLPPGRKVWLGLRPEHLSLGGTQLAGRLDAVESTGSMSFLSVEAAGGALQVALTGRTDAREGDAVGLAIEPRHLHVFDHATERAL